MDTNTLVLIVVAFFIIVALLAIWRYRDSIEIIIESAGNKLGIKGKNSRRRQSSKPNPNTNTVQQGARIADSESGQEMTAEATGGPATIERSKSAGSMKAISKNPPDPKA